MSRNLFHKKVTGHNVVEIYFTLKYTVDPNTGGWIVSPSFCCIKVLFYHLKSFIPHFMLAIRFCCSSSELNGNLYCEYTKKEKNRTNSIKISLIPLLLTLLLVSLIRSIWRCCCLGFWWRLSNNRRTSEPQNAHLDQPLQQLLLPTVESIHWPNRNLSDWQTTYCWKPLLHP